MRPINFVRSESFVLSKNMCLYVWIRKYPPRDLSHAGVIPNVT